jgi:sugar-specific transcriptional regulator TrmB
MNLPKVLQSYGLSEREAKIYLATLELGSGPATRIAEKAQMPRSTVYEVLEHLAHQGFVFTFNKKKIKYFSAEDPAQVVRLAESKANTLRDALPQLNAIAGEFRKRPTVRFYQGHEQMKIVLEEMLEEADVLLSFAAPEDLFRELGDYFNKFVEKRVKRKIPVRMIAADSPKARERQRIGLQELRTVKIVPDIYPYHSNKWIWKNKIAMFSFVGDLVAVVIESKELADMERAMFEHLWGSVGAYGNTPLQ